jgi:chemotaxis protein histidine kinase CheA
MSVTNNLPTINQPTAISDRYLLTAVGKYTLVLPATWVIEVLRIEQSKVLQMPHYSPAIFGIAYYQNSFLTLLAGWYFLPESQSNRAEHLTVVRLCSTVPNCQNVGIVVDRVLGSTVKANFPPVQQREFFILADSQQLSSELWQPLRV